MVDHRSVVDDGSSVVDNGGSVVDNGGSVVDDRGGVVDNRGMVDKRSVESWGNGGGSHDRGNPDNRGGGRGGDNRSSSNLDERGSLHCRLRREDGLALVGDGSVVALRSCGVCDDLNSAVGKVDTVLSSGVGSITLLGLGEHRVAEALVVHSVLVVVHRRQIRVGFNCDNRSGSILWPGSGTREHGCEERQLGHLVADACVPGGMGG